MNYRLYATCPEELTMLLADEIKKLGGQNIETSYRSVFFDADEELYYKAHLQLRLASRVCRVIKDVPCHSPTILFDKLKKIKFHELFSPKEAVKVNVTIGTNAGNIEGHLIGSKIREAITDSFKHFAQAEANLSSWEARIHVIGFYYRNRLMLSLDTSLKSLHKRGYRVEGHPAPLKETLASALLYTCEYNGDVPLYDPMCGSGSIVIEGAQIAMNKAPLIHRKKDEFGFEFLADFNSELWRKVQEKARQDQYAAPKNPIYASDINEEFLELARETALRARVEKYIQFAKKDFFKTTKPCDKGLLIANIPYGMRLDDEPIEESYVKAVGDHLKKNFQGWRCGILMPKNCPYKKIGLKPDKKAFFLNGSVEVVFVVFDIY